MNLHSYNLLFEKRLLRALTYSRGLLRLKRELEKVICRFLVEYCVWYRERIGDGGDTRLSITSLTADGALSSVAHFNTSCIFRSLSRYRSEYLRPIFFSRFFSEPNLMGKKKSYRHFVFDGSSPVIFALHASAALRLLWNSFVLNFRIVESSNFSSRLERFDELTAANGVRLDRYDVPVRSKLSNNYRCFL